ncbi:MAG: UTP--glucose-1-phosphate uridylyltransferase [Spirochaetaceae bacterium]|nr:MAG: UTP--glucose-1-phosphate uridylyltransferase [Spirochaetaceae bacterium]
MSAIFDSRIIEQWKARGQDHLFDYWDERAPEMKQALLDDLQTLENDVYELLRQQLKQQLDDKGQRHIEPIAHIPEREWRGDARARAMGEDLLAAGKVAFLTVAGGQGSRLGFEGPKGCFPISPIREATLFQILAEKILAARNRLNRPLFWYIMTSDMNFEETRRFLESNGYFGLREQEVSFFTQGLFPSLSAQGQLLLAEDGRLFQNPNGHGGTIAALRDSGCIDHMRENGVEELFFFQVDNPLVRIPDYPFLGGHVQRGSQMSTKVVEKAYPEEKLGVIGYVNGKPGVIEYSDISEKNQKARDDRGNLLYSHGSIAVHIFNVDFLDSHSGRLPLHVARKQIQSWKPEPGGGVVQQREAVKFEMFIFDALADAENPLFFETTREEEFAPLKNKTGPDSIDTCRQGMINLYARWLEANGVTVPMRDGKPVHRIEISPTFAWDAQSLRESLKQRRSTTVNRIDEDILLT